MSQENVEIIALGFARFLETRQPPWEILDEAIEVHDHDTLDDGIHRGHAGYARWLGQWDEAWSEWQVTASEYVDAGDSVIVVVRLTTTGQGSGIELKGEGALVYKIRADMVVRCDYYGTRAEALEHVGLHG